MTLDDTHQDGYGIELNGGAHRCFNFRNEVGNVNPVSVREMRKNLVYSVQMRMLTKPNIIERYVVTSVVPIL